MIAAGSGITPVYQIIQHLLEEIDHKFSISLIFLNVVEEDILLRKELE